MATTTPARLVNLTPHDVHIYDATGTQCVTIIQRNVTDPLPRVDEERVAFVARDPQDPRVRLNFPVTHLRYTNVSNMPAYDPEVNVIYIVSMPVAFIETDSSRTLNKINND